jgi:hypothetical protein
MQPPKPKDAQNQKIGVRPPSQSAGSQALPVGSLTVRRSLPRCVIRLHPGAMRTLPPFGADGESMLITALAMPIRVFCAPADHAAEITDPLAVRDAGAGWSWPDRYGGASRVRRSIVPPGCWAGGPGASALREGGLTGSPDVCTIRACGSAVTGPAASAGLTGFARSGIASWRRGRRNAPSRVPLSPPACAPAGSGTAVSAAGLRG